MLIPSHGSSNSSRPLRPWSNHTQFPLSICLPSFLDDFHTFSFYTSSLFLCSASCFSEKNQSSQKRSSTDSHHLDLPCSTGSAFLAAGGGSAVLTPSNASQPSPAGPSTPTPAPSGNNFLSLMLLMFQTLLDHSQQCTNVLLFSHCKTNTKTKPPFF